ncbi:MAG: right-handed parallel beta-helix repeat-containing protein [Geminicoccaceae bacterium]
MRRFLVLALAVAFTGPVLANPPVPASREAINEALDGIQSLPLPVPEAGEIRVGRPADERRLNRGFLEDLAAQPDWPDEGIVIAAGRHRLEEVAAELRRPELLACGDDTCRLAAPLAVENGAVLVIDGLTVRLEQRAGAAIVAFGDLFVSLSAIEGRAGDAPATTDGTTFRPFVVAYDRSRTVIRGSRLTALGYDAAGTTGLAVTVTSRDDPPARPVLQLVGNLIENMYDGVQVRGAAEATLLRNRIRASLRHGIAVRDGAADSLIADNDIVGSGTAVDSGNGLLMSRGITRTSVLANRIVDSAGAAIQIDKGGFDLTFAGNELARSGRDGLVLYESWSVDLQRNAIARNGRSGIRIRAADGILVSENGLTGNARAGIELQDWSTVSKPPSEEEAALIRPTEATVKGNRFTDNAKGNCLVQGVVTVLPEEGNDC